MSDNDQKGKLKIILNQESLPPEDQKKLLEALAKLGGIAPDEITNVTIRSTSEDSPKP